MVTKYLLGILDIALLVIVVSVTLPILVVYYTYAMFVANGGESINDEDSAA